MTLADKLSESQFPQFPQVVGPSLFSSFDLKGLATNRYLNFRQVSFAGNLIVYAGGPNDTKEEIEEYIEGSFNGITYKDSNINNKYDNAFEEKVADIRLFISHDGAYLLKTHHELEKIGDNEIAIFLEIPDKDVFSGEVCFKKQIYTGQISN